MFSSISLKSIGCPSPGAFSAARAQEGQVYEAAKLWINLYTLRAIAFKERGEL
jgi:hypothetical protein